MMRTLFRTSLPWIFSESLFHASQRLPYPLSPLRLHFLTFFLYASLPCFVRIETLFLFTPFSTHFLLPLYAHLQMRNLKLLRHLKGQGTLDGQLVVQGFVDSENNIHYFVTEEGWLFGFALDSGKVCLC